MSNLALHKSILESGVENASVVTNGDTENYTSSSGFAFFNYPGTITLDLESVYDIACIQFLLWDGLGAGGTKLNPRRYRYRLGISTDNSRWQDIYTTPDDGTVGWQIFKFRPSVQLRYIRIYGLHNTHKPRFHIVELEAHDVVPPMPSGHIGTDEEIRAVRTVPDVDISNVAPFDEANLTETLQTLESSKVIDPSLLRQLRARFDDLTVLNQNLSALRNEIVEPVTIELEKSNSYAKWALLLTIIALITTIALGPLGQTLWAWVRSLIQTTG